MLAESNAVVSRVIKHRHVCFTAHLRYGQDSASYWEHLLGRLGEISAAVFI